MTLAKAARSASGEGGKEYGVAGSLSVKKMLRSGKPGELLAYEEIDAGAIVKAVRGITRMA